MKTEVWTDPIVAETRRWREELMAETDYDLTSLTERLMKSQTRHGERLVSLESTRAEGIHEAPESDRE
jgi:hypothetical protein